MKKHYNAIRKSLQACKVFEKNIDLIKASSMLNIMYFLTLHVVVCLWIGFSRGENNALITFNTIYKMQQILWETADNEILVQKCDVYLATAL